MTGSTSNETPNLPNEMAHGGSPRESSRKTAVLAVDDTPANLDLVEAALSGLECNFVRAASGKEALTLVDAQDFALILMDVVMQGMDGFDTAERIRRHPRSHATPIIFLTASVEAHARVFEGYQTGAVDYLIKPVDPQILRAKVVVFMELARAREQLERLLEERDKTQRQLASYTAELRLKNEELEGDLQMARELQQAFLPRRQSDFPYDSPSTHTALHLVHRYMPSETVGGDFSSVLPLSRRKVGVLIGDVMGHGVRAALLTGVVRGLVQQLKDEAHDPGEFLGGINRALVDILRQADTSIFASAFYLVADIATGRFRYASAGHPSPLLLRPGAQTVEPLFPDGGSRFGPALGIFGDATYQTHECHADSSDSVMFFTDGLFEIEGDNDDFYDQKRLLEAVRKRIDMPLEKLFSDLLAELRRFALHHEFEDDICLMGINLDDVGAPVKG